MANLVSPGYKQSKLINSVLSPVEERCLEFKGLNKRKVVEEGEMSDMKNLTSDDYPVLSPRKPRGEMELPTGVVLPLRIMARYEKIALIARDDEDQINFYFDGAKVPEVDDLTYDSQMVAINTKICFFPQKTCISVLQTATSASIVVGSYKSLEESATLSGTAVTISNTDCRITLPGLKAFAYDDAINISGTLSYTSEGTAKTMECTVSCLIEEVIQDTANQTTELVLPRETFIELTGEGAASNPITLTGELSRTMPDLDYVMEWNNRLWGASSEDNTIYACKLGDPTNWQYYQGLSLDSYYAQQGTDGHWTGCAAHSSHAIFFKQNSMARIYGSSPSTWQISNMQCFGVEEGSDRSVVVINDSVFYKSKIGIMVYEGGTPYCISDKFNATFRNVVGATEGNKYYASIQSGDGFPLMVLDIELGVWHKEDNARMIDACAIGNRLYFINHAGESIKCGEADAIASPWLPCGHGAATSGTVQIVNPVNATEKASEMEWMAQFGPFDEFLENRKIYSRILMRLIRSAESSVKVYISENEGPWELVNEFDPATTGGDYIPIIPRRCDRYSIKIVGTGKCSIKSLTRKVRRGTGGRL